MGGKGGSGGEGNGRKKGGEAGVKRKGRKKTLATCDPGQVKGGGGKKALCEKRGEGGPTPRQKCHLLNQWKKRHCKGNETLILGHKQSKRTGRHSIIEKKILDQWMGATSSTDKKN